MTLLRVCIFALVFASVSSAQQTLQISRERMCSWNEDAVLPDDLYSFPPDSSTTKVVDNIMKYTGLQVNFELIASNVPNAVATMQGNRRLILYNQVFMNDIAQQSGTNWAATAILAHEIGHHLMQHTLGSGGVKSEQELAADKFSGDVLFKMGATLEQAKAAMESRPETRSPYYPKKAVRLIAIANGYIAARDLASSKTPSPVGNQVDSTQSETDSAAKERERRAEEARAERERKAEQAEEEAREERAEERRQKAEEDAEEARQERKRNASRGCYDGFGRRWCNLPPETPLGSGCFCFGVPGSGVTGAP